MVGCSGPVDAPDDDNEGSTAGTGSQNPPSGNAGTGQVTPSAGAANNGGAASAGSGNGNGGMPGGSGSGNSTAGAGSNNGGNGTAGAAGGSAQKPIPDFKFPAPVGADQKLSSTKEVDTFDGKLARFVGTGDLGKSSGEGLDPLFRVKAGGTLKNVIIGAPASDGVHCEGSCTIENVWWEDVGEDAITFDGSSSTNQYRITGGGAKKADDKVLQHNGGGTVYVKNFLVEDFGKLYRSCGNCGDQYARHVEFDTIVANGSKSVLAGINQNYKDSAKFKNVFADLTMKICERYQGNDSGDEPTSLGSGADGTYCIYATSDVAWH